MTPTHQPIPPCDIGGFWGSEQLLFFEKYTVPGDHPIAPPRTHRVDSTFLVTSVCDCVGVRGSNEASSFGMACLLIFAGVRSVAGLPKIVPTI